MSQRNRNIILWVVAIGLLVSMVISFTPGSLFGNRAQQEAAEGPVALNVNGEPIRELEVSRLEQNPPFNAVQEGPVAQDLQLVLLDQLVTQTLLQQAAADESVSSGEIRTRVNEFREQQGVAGSRNDRAYQNLLAGAGYTDDTFRDLTRQQLQQEKYLANLTADATPTDAEIQTYYQANQQAYQSEPRITAREIVVADESKANALYAQALTGADFAALARENSTERAEQGGALGAAEGESAPQPVTSVALPTAVSQAAFALQGPGLTTPIEAGGVYHIVKVEAYTPAATRPLSEVRSEVEKDLTDLQEAAAEENALRTLKANAEITSPAGSNYQYRDSVVAKVGDRTITAAELDRNTYLNPQIQQLLNPNFAGIIESSVKPNVLTQMIDAQLAVQGARSLKGTFVGPDSAVAQSALGYVSRDVKVTPAQVRSFYGENSARYTEQPSALTTRVNFADAASARDFRQALTTADAISTDSIGIAAEAAGGSVQDLGNVAPGVQPEQLDSVLFNFQQGMTALGQSGFDISQVLTLEVPASSASGGAASGGAVSGGAASGGTASGGTTTGATVPATEQFVVLVAARTPERVRPLSDVRAQVEQAALQQQRNQAQQTWLDGLREKFPVENLLASAQTPTDTQSGGIQSGGVQSGGIQSGGAPVGNVPSEAPSPAASGGAQGATPGGSSSANPPATQDENVQNETSGPNSGVATESSSSPNQQNTAGNGQNGATQGAQPSGEAPNRTQPGTGAEPSGETQNAAPTRQNQSETQNGNATQGEGVAASGNAPGKVAPPTPQQKTPQQDPEPTDGAAQGTTESDTGSEPQQNSAPQNQNGNTQNSPQTEPSTQSNQGNQSQGNQPQSTTPPNNGVQGGSAEPTTPTPTPAPTPPGNGAN